MQGTFSADGVGVLALLSALDLEEAGARAAQLPWSLDATVSVDDALQWLETVAARGGVLGVRARFLRARLILVAHTVERREK